MPSVSSGTDTSAGSPTVRRAVLAVLVRLGAEARALGIIALAVVAAMPELVTRPGRWRRLVEEAASAMHTVFVAALAVVLVALMLVVEFAFHMRLVLRQDSLVPAFSTTMLVRELVPVVVAIVFAARVGASVAAEVATMKSTEQLDALRVSGVDPVRWLAMPIVAASVFVVTGLVALGLVAGCWASATIAGAKMGRSASDFANYMFLFTRPYDVFVALGKGALFGALVALCGLHAGFRATEGSRGVGEAATRAMVLAIAAVIAADFVLTSLAFR